MNDENNHIMEQSHFSDLHRWILRSVVVWSQQQAQEVPECDFFISMMLSAAFWFTRLIFVPNESK
jgi:hypothetical protein